MRTRPDRVLPILCALLLAPPLALLVAGPPAPAAPAAPPQPMVGPSLPPDFYGTLPEAFPGPEAPEGVKRLALVYSGTLVGETEPCG